MELHRTDGLCLMLNPFIRAVIKVDKPFFPVGSQCTAIHCKTMVLTRDKAVICTDHTHRLIMAPMPVFELINLSPCSQREKLITHTDTIDGLISGNSSTQVLYGLGTHFGIPGAIADKNTIVGECGKVVVPRNTHQGNIFTQQLTDDIVLHSTIDQYYRFRALPIAYHFSSRSLSDQVTLFPSSIFYWGINALNSNCSLLRTMLTKVLCKSSCINICKPHSPLLFEAICERRGGIPMTVFCRIIRHQDSLHVDMLALEITRDALGRHLRRWNAIIPHHGVSHHHHLSHITWVCQALGIAIHGCIEYNLSYNIFLCSKRIALK